MDPRRIIANVPGSPRLWLMLVAACALAYGFVEIVDDVFHDPLEGDRETQEFDAGVMDFLRQFRSDALTQAAIDLTALGSVSVLAVFAILGYAAIIGARDWLGLLHMSIALLGAMIWPALLKPWFERERPPLADHLVSVVDLSFPSGHAFGAATAYATFAFFCARFLRSYSVEAFCYAFAFLIVAVVGTTRIYLGVHYASDVLAGISAGGAWAFALAALFSLRYERQQG